MKRCTACNLEKPSSDFYMLPSGAPRSMCKTCCRAEQKARNTPGHQCCPGCGEPVRLAGYCGFCIEEASEIPLTEPERIEVVPRSTREHRLATARMAAGERGPGGGGKGQLVGSKARSGNLPDLFR